MGKEILGIGAKALSGIRGAIRFFEVTLDQTGETQLTGVQCSRVKKDDDLEAEISILETKRMDLIFKASDIPYTINEKDFKITWADGSIWRPFAELGTPAINEQGVTGESIVLHCHKVPE